MNGPLKMYKTKQIVNHDFKVQLPDCMYKLKNIHASRNGMVEQGTGHISSPPKKLDIFHQNNQGVPEMAALEERQEQILQQLADLKKQMHSIRKSLKISTDQATDAPVTKKKLKQAQTQPPQNLPDIIINASPTHPPYSLELIQKLWKSYVFLSVKTFVHSSLKALSEDAAQLGKNLENFSPDVKVPVVNVRLIWKDVGADTEMILSHTPIVGEVNILRYLSRVSYDHLNYETYPNCHEIDSLLDVVYGILKVKTKTERASLLQDLNKSLGKCQWLGGRKQISIVDLAAYSAIKQVTSSNEINVNLSKWLQRCVAC